MVRSAIRWSTILACSLLWAAPAQAQTCLGQLPFSTAPLQGGGGVVFSSESRSVLGEVGHGNEVFFGRGGFEFSSLSGIDSGVKGLVGQAGAEYEVEAGTAMPMHACPIMSVAKLWGPSPAPTLDYSSFIIGFGGSVGFDAMQTGTTRVVPTAGVSFNRFSTTLGGDAAADASWSDSFGMLQFGAGLIFNETMALTPSLAVPFGLDGGEVGFTVRFAMSIQ